MMLTRYTRHLLRVAHGRKCCRNLSDPKNIAHYPLPHNGRESGPIPVTGTAIGFDQINQDSLNAKSIGRESKRRASDQRVITPRVALLVEIRNQPGALFDLLKYFWKHEVDLTHIESRPTMRLDSPPHHHHAPVLCLDRCRRDSNTFNIYIDYEGSANDSKSTNLIRDLHKNVQSLLVLSEKEVPWFPM
jgi:hypothetical protein